MQIRKVKLNNYRNYASADVEFRNGLNIISGKNAQGKTNLLESIYLSSIGRSARTPRDKELIKWNETNASVFVEAEKKSGTETVEIYLSQNENKRIRINGLPIMRMGELMGVINTIYFSPDEMRLIKEGPSERRRFMDIDISQLSAGYFYTLNNYNKILAQRNKLLKTGHDVDGTLSIWDTQAAKEGSRIIKQRKGFIRRLAPYVKSAHEYLTGGKETLDIKYLSYEGETDEEIYQTLMEDFKRQRKHDTERGYTHTGPHKDDISLVINSSTDIRTYGSQGQQRTAALALKLAELEIFADIIGEYPVLLLDDVMSELDETRQRLLLEKSACLQTVITTTHFMTDIPAHKLFIESGMVVNG